MLPTLVSQSSEDRGYGMIAQQVSTDGVSKSSSASSAAAAYTSINSSANVSEDETYTTPKRSSRRTGGTSSKPMGVGAPCDIKNSSGDNPSASVDSILFGSPVNKLSSPLSASSGGYGTAPKVDYKNLRSYFDDTPGAVGAQNGGGTSRANKSQLPSANGHGIPGSGKVGAVANGSSMDSSLWG